MLIRLRILPLTGNIYIYIHVYIIKFHCGCIAAEFESIFVVYELINIGNIYMTYFHCGFIATDFEYATLFIVDTSL